MGEIAVSPADATLVGYLIEREQCDETLHFDWQGCNSPAAAKQKPLPAESIQQGDFFITPFDCFIRSPQATGRRNSILVWDKTLSATAIVADLDGR